mmetsp:Transcript_29595/g.74338  ORF Transcript_29595/g.74338 Transcript_29595/m.74338 type:complete len:203 (-) Transcript_29595:709-1317(-)
MDGFRSFHVSSEFSSPLANLKSNKASASSLLKVPRTKQHNAHRCRSLWPPNRKGSTAAPRRLSADVAAAAAAAAAAPPAAPSTKDATSPRRRWSLGGAPTVEATGITSPPDDSSVSSTAASQSAWACSSLVISTARPPGRSTTDNERKTERYSSGIDECSLYCLPYGKSQMRTSAEPGARGKQRASPRSSSHRASGFAATFS